MAPIDLLDVNVWLALSDENHVHHRRALRYWELEGAPQLAFCRVTMLGLLRLATNATVMAGQPFKPAEAWTAYRAFRNLPEVIFLNETAELESRLESLTDHENFPVKRWTDAYLASLANVTGCRFVSFDQDFRRFPELPFHHLQP